jgi:hypothetical protein
MKKNLLSGRLLMPAVLLFLAMSCKKESGYEPVKEELVTAPGNSSSSANAQETDLLRSVRNATAKFHSTTQAIMAGYVADEHCVSVPGLGGMGFHWVNPSFVDPVFDPLQPEAVLYAPGPGGNLKLIALEYIIINVGQPRPRFGDQLFDIGGTPVPVPHWSLHVWLYETNPSGMFAPFNPNVSCE